MEENIILKEMGKRIYHRRKFLNLTQEGLAEKMGVSTQMISNLELGKKAIRPENLIKLCETLNVSADFILTGTDTCSSSNYFLEKIITLDFQERTIISNILDYMNRNK